MAGKKIRSLSELYQRFWSYTVYKDACWVWQGALNKGGYGDFRSACKWGLPRRAHRFAYEIDNDISLGEEKEIDHICKNRACVRPSHLQVVSKGWNRLQGAKASPKNTKIKCLRGHLRIPENLRHGRCRICEINQKRLRREMANV